ncbi:YheC/YheD family protein [Virgibacillus sp. C22-A2]|uniref:YheC/YheD family protein n=1 Tax=Virgibacillus tibetensis TaxID=3042313 RepID=A0ABU6KLF1_9BACI|nr:YheC/YheD family protein [Virgibacillus sp. C22-A2]
MKIGIMTNFNRPTRLAELTAIICKYYDIEVIYLRPRDVNIEEDKVRGKVLVNNSWLSIETEIPPFIDIAPYCYKRKNQEITTYLRNKTFLSDNRDNVLSKQKLQDKLKSTVEFSDIVIPTQKIYSINDIIDFLDKYTKVVMKPTNGIRGRGVYVLEKKNECYYLGYQKESVTLTYKELEDFFQENIKDRGFILQKHISSRTVQGDPFDCRVHVEKNQDGEWTSAKNYIRIGIGQKVISNVNQGGGISELVPFLKSNFEDEWENIVKKINELSVTLPRKVEELRNTHIMSLGLDIGIDENGSLYLFEVNDGPATATLTSEVAVLRSSYYKYILENCINTSEKYSTDREVIKKDYLIIEKKLNDYMKKNYELENQLNYYKKKYLSIENSTSWFITKPVRWLGSFKKK